MTKIQFTGTATQPQQKRIFRQFNKDQYCKGGNQKSQNINLLLSVYPPSQGSQLIVKINNPASTGSFFYATNTFEN